MSTHLKSLEINLEKAVLRFLSPNGLMVAVGLIVFTVVLFSGSGIENRMMDGPVVGEFHTTTSPLLASAE
jgi:hypothetical protein